MHLSISSTHQQWLGGPTHRHKGVAAVLRGHHCSDTICMECQLKDKQLQ